MPDLLLAWLCLPLAVYILLSGLDDLWMDLLWIVRRAGRGKTSRSRPLEGPIAVWVPCWQEAAVIERMLAHNLAAIADRDFDFFLGVYPNDFETARAADRAARNDCRVHVAETPHPGPTSKADCLNWIYQRMLLKEEESGKRYSLVVIHDSEDLIHPRSFQRIRQAAGAGYGMIQVPVLALTTPCWEFPHGLYCDDFAESQSKDLIGRVEIGGFLPGCGVGTGFRRETLDRLACAEANRLFDPSSLTEDYDNGLRLFREGARQVFLPLEWESETPVATREYFPRTLAGAVRQRSRWITGNTLQAWERFGWGEGLKRPWVQRYFFWRDRKGLWGAPIGSLANVLFGYGVWTWLTQAQWRFGEVLESLPLLLPLLWFNATLLAERTAVRIAVVAEIYGLRFAMLSPLRTFLGNWLNSAACARALCSWLRSRWWGIPLRWVKTEHAYPNREALSRHRRKLAEILTSNGYCTQETVDAALAEQGEEGLGDCLVGRGMITERELCEAVSLQEGMAMTRLDETRIRANITRSLPERLQRQYGLLPIEAREGELHVAAVQAPPEALVEELRRYTRLTIRFWLATHSDMGRVRATLQSRS